MSTTKEECIHEGGEWVTTYRKSDGTVVRPFCRNIGTHRDRNGNTRDMWRKERGTLFDMTEYNLSGGEIEGVVKKDKRNNKVKWWISVDGRQVSEGTSKSVSDAKFHVEEEMRRK